MIEVENLSKSLRRQARRRRLEFHRPARHRHRLPRPERRREVHHDADDRRARRAHAPAGPRQRQATTATRRRPLRELGVAAGGQGRAHRPVGPQPPARPGPDARASRRGGSTRSSTWSACARSPASGSAASPSAWASGSASASALLGDPQTLVLDEPVNGLDPEGVLWIRTLLRELAAEGRTVFVSSHLMSEMAQTATRLVVIGRGRLIADTTVDEFVGRVEREARASSASPEAVRLRDLLAGPDVTVTSERAADVLLVHGLTRRASATPPGSADVPDPRTRPPDSASLEDAFMQLTQDSSSTARASSRPPEPASMTTAVLTRRPSGHRPRRAGAAAHPGPGHPVRVDQVPLAALDALDARLAPSSLTVGFGALLTALAAHQFSVLERPTRRRRSTRPARRLNGLIFTRAGHRRAGRAVHERRVRHRA